MTYITKIAYHDAYLEVLLTIPGEYETEIEAKQIGNGPELTVAMLYEDKLVVGKGFNEFTVLKRDTNSYQFKVCSLTQSEVHKKGNMLTEKDYKNISWDEAITYIEETYPSLVLPFPLESYYYAVFTTEGTYIPTPYE